MPHAYRIVRVADPRSRGACSWYEIEGIAADGARWHVATCDDRHEARETVRRIEAAEAAVAARSAATDAARQALAAARAAARSVQLYRRAVAGRLGGDSWAVHRDRSASLVADRRAIAAAIREARRTLAALARFSA